MRLQPLTRLPSLEPQRSFRAAFYSEAHYVFSLVFFYCGIWRCFNELNNEKESQISGQVQVAGLGLNLAESISRKCFVIRDKFQR
jgi:hypothetical protein